MYEASYELPDGYQVQLMVLQDFPGGRQRRGLRMNVYRSRVWIGHEAEPEPLLHRSQEHADLSLAIDACYSMLLTGGRQIIESPVALGAVAQCVDAHFCGQATAV